MHGYKPFILSQTHAHTHTHTLGVVHVQSQTRPTGVNATGIGARTMRVEWSYSGGILSSISGFTIILSTIGERPANSNFTVSLSNSNLREYTISGIVPYRYFDNSGVMFEVHVAAIRNINNALVFAQNRPTITLPCEQEVFTVVHKSV